MDINVDMRPDIALVIQMLISTVLPLLVALVTKRSTKSSTKAVLLALLALISSGLTELLAAIQTDVAFDLGTWAVSAITTFIIAVGMYFGLWKPTEVARKVQAVGVRDDPQQ